MHHRAHCERGDWDQREEFYLPILLKKLLTFSFQVANFSAVSISLPTLQKEMKLEPAQLQWVMAAYPLSSVSCPILVRGLATWPTASNFFISCPYHTESY
jgi:hypothetical protein